MLCAHWRVYLRTFATYLTEIGIMLGRFYPSFCCLTRVTIASRVVVGCWDEILLLIFDWRVKRDCGVVWGLVIARVAAGSGLISRDHLVVLSAEFV